MDPRNKIIESVKKGVPKSQTARNALVGRPRAEHSTSHDAKDAGGFFAHRDYGTFSGLIATKCWLCAPPNTREQPGPRPRYGQGALAELKRDSAPEGARALLVVTV